ncbi:hypothetical protein PC129_g1726 [Phytophthora cactorum]|uniref:Uncharacterized protein n=1 Tax=Phytophthora cactorum TaxID=29920 RepID=A0A329RZR5_9STRA|nr:hypothetical protein Pcac1_g7574 [Phytophthora cactorum]KAG2832605.1 hypothetical protein PC112_g6849 [Phytophthora cactorum]KAG2880847.1 hypothetical protein PC114_g21869 [Phytophthora cactorum]KAG2932327.1 hypothetical protein PC115_g5849 [Phytophthora cactorum]KAG2949165.1 hypothetical protein PC117_g5492 [Phytophthora cactorum]
MSAGQILETTSSVETVNVPVHATGKPSYECVGVDVTPSHELDALLEEPVRWTHGTDIHRFGCRKDEEQSGGVEDTLSAKRRKERFDENSWDSLKASPFYDVLWEHEDVLPDEIPAELS